MRRWYWRILAALIWVLLWWLVGVAAYLLIRRYLL